MKPFATFGWLVTAFLAAGMAAGADPPRTVDFNRDVRPILSETCFQCHGPDQSKRKAKLRLDTREGLFHDFGDHKTLVPGQPVESEIYNRISSPDDLDRMPPPKFAKSLSQAQIVTIKRWIEEGAEWKGHWAYIPPTRPEVPRVPDPTGFARNDIDRFILAKLEENGLKPAPEADRVTLIRRLSFDLIGLPPTPEQVDAFVHDQDPKAYETLVDRLLASPEYGERMALYWLDLVRYADSAGYHSDNPRNVYLYRDYVIKAFNENMPFDRFTVEQLAGDLLPNPTDSQKIASGYNRLLQTTEEGGGQAKEYLAKYAADRVRNVGSVWLASTLGCSECHDHKFDPFLTREFYGFQAFFADLKETPVGRQEEVKMPSAEEKVRVQELANRIAAEQKVIDTPTPELASAQGEWEKTLGPLDAAKAKGLPAKVVEALRVEQPQRSDAQKQELAAYYRGNVAPALAASRKALADLKAEKEKVEKAIPSTLIAEAVPPRTIRVLPRGNWLDETGPIVEPTVPASLGTVSVRDRRPTRLDLAHWLVARENPLTARVFVNRLWKLAFGQGLVTSLEDFGSQGAWPTHPHLLDWLAVEFVDSGWNVKQTLKQMVMSATYRQSSVASEDVRQRDPANRWLSRQGRFRLDAEMIRDNALAVSGLLENRVGGPSVKPFQPAGYWAHLNFPRREYENDHGPNEYRRGLYTWWQRSFLHPSLLAFDACTREECTVQRARSNTPLQALVLLNDPNYVEAARAFGERLIREGGSDTASRIQWAYRLALSRPARPAEVDLLTKLTSRLLDQYRADQSAANELLHVGDSPVPPNLDPAELAAWTSVARVILNLHETITRN